MTLEGVQRPRQGQPPEEGKNKPRGMCRAAILTPSVAWPSAKGPAHHRVVHGPSTLCAERARPLRGPCSSGPLVHRSGSTG